MISTRALNQESQRFITTSTTNVKAPTTRQAKYLPWRQSMLNNTEVDDLPVLQLHGSWLLLGRTYARRLFTAICLMGTPRFVRWLVFFVEEKLCLTGQKDIRELKQPRRRRQQNPPQICIFDKEKQYFCTLCTFIFSYFDILNTFSFFLLREMTCFAVVWTT